MRRYGELPEMAEGNAPAAVASRAEASPDPAMRCGGCGSKIGSSALGHALARLKHGSDDVLIGLDASDDAAVLELPPGKLALHSVDFFRAVIDAPYLFGQIAANHALGDIYTMGGAPHSALAIVTVPYGPEPKIEEEIFQMLAGAIQVLRASNTALVGGHTGEGAETALGFAVNGLADPDQILRKAGMRPGDRLLLTKPLGTGTLLAAAMRRKAKDRWIDAALASMLQFSREAACCLQQHRATACTDITGFGLLGHLLEMTRSSQVDVALRLDAIPALDGALETARSGIVSSLQPVNARAAAAIRPDGQRDHAIWPLLFDPQTAGGLLASVPEKSASACACALYDLGYRRAAIIGTVLPRGDQAEPITLVD